MVKNFAPTACRRSLSEVVTWGDIRMSIMEEK